MEFTKLNGEKILGNRQGKWPQRLPMAMLAAAIFGLSAAAIVFSQLPFETSSKLGPRAIIERYQWFEDTAANIYNKQREILIYESFLKEMSDSHEGKSSFEWPVADGDQFLEWSKEVISLKREHDVLSRKFNAEMNEVNWKLVDSIEMAKAKVKPIPRQFTVYNVPPPQSSMPSKW